MNTTFNYTKKAIDSPKGLFIAREEKETGLFHFYFKPGKQLHPSFVYDFSNNRMRFSGAASFTPQALADAAALADYIFDM